MLALALSGCGKAGATKAAEAPAAPCDLVLQEELSVMGVGPPTADDTHSGSASSSAYCESAANEAAKQGPRWGALRIEWTSFADAKKDKEKGGSARTGVEQAKAEYQSARGATTTSMCSEQPVTQPDFAMVDCFEPGSEYGPTAGAMIVRHGPKVVFVSYQGVGYDPAVVHETIRRIADRAIRAEA
ncbi:hypothetical protein [Streptodolium elevatio]|uniref:PknH-like extracellular domain-containing protein n=1 Tax=Streptodolium elevatio TaxID=3157996 RepID=A0ABV3DWA9_9ACTN